MQQQLGTTRREALSQLGRMAGAGAAIFLTSPCPAENNTRLRTSIDRGLQWVARTQSKLGHWTASNYPTAMTALAGTALLCAGSTTTQGPFSKQIRRAVDYLMNQVRPNGLIGDPVRDNRYTYGHGFSIWAEATTLDIQMTTVKTTVVIRIRFSPLTWFCF